MSSDLERIAARLRELAYRVETVRQALPPVCDTAARAAAALGAASAATPARLGAPHPHQLAAHFHAVARQRDPAMAALLSARHHLDTLAASLARGATTTAGVDISPDARPGTGPGLTDHAYRPGPLGPDFTPGIHIDPRRKEALLPHELSTVERLAAEAMDIRILVEDHTQKDKKNVNALIRRSPDDPGQWTELKAANANSSTTIKRAIMTAGKQLHSKGGGDLVLDGRRCRLTHATAEQALRRALGQRIHSGSSLPERIWFILDNGDIFTGRMRNSDVIHRDPLFCWP